MTGQTGKRIAAWLLALLLIWPAISAGEGSDVEEEYDPEYEETYEEEYGYDEEDDPEYSEREEAAEPEEEAPVAVVTDDGYQLDAEGFLTGENPGPEYILEDEKNGVWQYASKDLSIVIHRYREKFEKNKKRTREYCVAEIRTREEKPLYNIGTEAAGKYVHPGIRQDHPEKLMEDHPSVFAMSDDMYGLRIMPTGKNKTKYDYHGVIIRDGEIYATKTRKGPAEGKKDTRPWPNLDTMALYEDGSMKTFVSDELKAEEYLDQGAIDVFAFGPRLITDGEINPAVLNPKYYPYNEPRLAFGMVEPRHYIAIGVAGRPEKTYAGVHLDWLAEKMKEYGCREALNLDGGATVIMAFMNKAILRGDMSSPRNIGSMIAFGLREE